MNLYDVSKDQYNCIQFIYDELILVIIVLIEK